LTKYGSGGDRTGSKVSLIARWPSREYSGAAGADSRICFWPLNDGSDTATAVPATAQQGLVHGGDAGAGFGQQECEPSCPPVALHIPARNKNTAATTATVNLVLLV